MCNARVRAVWRALDGGNRRGTPEDQTECWPRHGYPSHGRQHRSVQGCEWHLARGPSCRFSGPLFFLPGQRNILCFLASSSGGRYGEGYKLLTLILSQVLLALTSVKVYRGLAFRGSRQFEDEESSLGGEQGGALITHDSSFSCEATGSPHDGSFHADTTSSYQVCRADADPSVWDCPIGFLRLGPSSLRHPDDFIMFLQ